MERRSLRVVILATGEKVSLKSIPNCWEKPLGTNLALCLEIVQLEFNFNLNNHLQLIGFLLG